MPGVSEAIKLDVNRRAAPNYYSKATGRYEYYEGHPVSPNAISGGMKTTPSTAAGAEPLGPSEECLWVDVYVDENAAERAFINNIPITPGGARTMYIDDPAKILVHSTSGGVQLYFDTFKIEAV